MDYDFLTTLRRQHPGWRLLAADHGPMVVAFLHRYFIEPNQRTFAESELASRLEDFLFHLRERLGESAFPKPAGQYLNDWAADERGWLRKYYPRDSDEPHYDLAPATEKALHWLVSLQGQRFIGAESRLLTVFELLREITEGTETNPRVRIEELTRRKADIEREIEEINAGRLRMMDDTRLRERFLQMSDTARALLADFRQVEQNFRDLDRQVREKVAVWDGGKADMLAEVFGVHDAITDTDQGRTFRAFWDFLMSARRQEELSALLEKVLALDPVRELEPDPRLQRVHYDWLEAGEATLRTVARLSEQLRRYLDDQAWLENRRIMQLLHEVEQHALAVREASAPVPGMTINEQAPSVVLPLERPLYRPPLKPRIAQNELATGDADLDAGVLFDQFYVDRAALRSRLQRALQTRDQITLAALLDHSPLERGLAELVAWLTLAADDPKALVDEAAECEVSWRDDRGMMRRATVPDVLFSR
ncbi:DUF3375 family protein [Seongchinamella sediminis]|uniref:DUF3375 family protein n=1 Tax=Seongchinamella sediminis TaxID=2283635 RepID=A0A3L7E2V0_9GAMM|nr:DUF3375 domain-containing protein [Seongchinamella sediminis]RLQ23894.1 DUF3375 family protein [Seongchinamella sediminis]